MLKIKPKYTVDLIDNGNHFYSVNGSKTYFDGVTTIIGTAYSKPWKTGWALKLCIEHISKFLLEHGTQRAITKEEIEALCGEARQLHEAVRDEAADLGKLCHKIIDELIVTGKTAVPMDISTQKRVEQFKLWREKCPYKIVAGDTKVASIELQYGGSLDFLAEDSDGRLHVYDAKFGKSIRQDHAYQVSGYARALKEMYGLDYLPQGHLVRFGVRSYNEKKVADMDRSLRGFYLCLGLYREFKREQYEESFLKPRLN